MKTFLSSTYIDLKEHRRAAAEALERLGQEVGRMEVFGARPDEPTAACLSEVEACDLFLGIYAHRYGFIPPGSDVSITEQEFIHASRHNKPIFGFFVSEKHPWPPKFIEGEPGRTKLIEFRQRFNERVICDVFTSPEDLAFKVAAAIGHYLARGRIERLTSQVQENLNKAGLSPESLAYGRTLSDVPEDTRAQLIHTLHDLRFLIDKFMDERSKTDTGIDPNALLTLAQGLMAEEKWLDAAKKYEDYAKLKPNDWHTNYLRSVAYANSRESYDTNIAALRACNDTIVFIPAGINSNMRARLFMYRGAILKRLGRLEEAEADLSIAKAHATGQYEVNDINYNLAGVYALRGEREQLLNIVKNLQHSSPYLSALRAHLDDYFRLFKNDKEFLEAIGDSPNNCTTKSNKENVHIKSTAWGA